MRTWMKAPKRSCRVEGLCRDGACSKRSSRQLASCACHLDHDAQEYQNGPRLVKFLVHGMYVPATEKRALRVSAHNQQWRATRTRLAVC